MEENKQGTSPEVAATPPHSAGLSARARRLERTYRLVLLAVLSAMVIVLQLFGSAIPIGTTSLSLVLIPIVVGGLVLGVKGGTFLGFLFGAFIFVWCGVLGYDPFTTFLFQQKPVITALICILKGTAAGFVPALLHRVLSRRLPFGSTVIAAAVAPICNTGLFLIGMLIIMNTLKAYLAGAVTVSYFFTAIILVNFAVELTVNLIASPAIYRVWQVIRRKRS